MTVLPSCSFSPPSTAIVYESNAIEIGVDKHSMQDTARRHAESLTYLVAHAT